MLSRSLLATAAALASLAAAQVTTDCNPMEKDCPNDPALATSQFFNFNQTQNSKLWETHVGTVDWDADTGAKLTVAKQGDSPTLRTKFYIFGGRVELSLKAAPGAGIISSMMLLGDNLDEIDWEFIGNNNTHATTNYYGKGVEDFTKGGWHPMASPPQDDYHNYTVDWRKDRLDWYIDSQLVRTVVPGAETLSDGKDTFPQTPLRLSLGIWAGGDPRMPEGTRKWAGGDTDYNAGPYEMHVKSVFVEDYSTGKEYKFGDRSGSWDSIEVISGNSTALNAINEPPEEAEKSTSEKFNALPEGAKIGIYIGSGVAGVALVAAAAFYIWRQRSQGIREARLADERDHLEMDGYRPDGGETEYKGAAGLGAGLAAAGLGASTYAAVNHSDPDEKSAAWGGADLGAGAGATMTRSGGYAAVENPFLDTRSMDARSIDARSIDTRSVANSGFSTPPPPMDMTEAEIPRSHSPVGASDMSPGPEQAYGAHRMQSYRD
ncbi:unnamed protein product [Clonostachys solani]|uniref:chitinase n=1 Tax=Clonostachys solani TaxID=160281 RepID=A0A9N9W2V2_9HYPO|nr:unnamed protein product [Clonostachys solani]